MTFHRRSFIQAAAVGAVASQGRAVAQRRKTGLPVLMKVGTQQGHSPQLLRALAAFGVPEICSGEIAPRLNENWSVDGLRRLRDQVASFGIRLSLIPLPMSSSPITRANYPNILLGKSPERDAEIEEISQMIRNAGKAGIPAVKYNLTFLGVPRSESTPCRGGATCSTFVYEKAKLDPKVQELARGSEEMMWERIEYFLKRVVPVAEEAKVRLACHPNDPGMPKGGFHGVPSVLSSVEGLKRFIEIAPSPYHGLNFCQGTVCEMLKDPRKEIPDVIRYFGKRKKIFNVHFRNIKGGFLNFQEVFPDNGDVNMLECVRVYKEVGYDGMLMPDHVPRIQGERSDLAFAYVLGYIQAAIQMVKEEG
ncbi:MAG: mannonate dehydratase [Bryobacterales bacterium]|nr:mannonate dehydratase [Bryobacterales bacterium]